MAAPTATMPATLYPSRVAPHRTGRGGVCLKSAAPTPSTSTAAMPGFQ